MQRGGGCGTGGKGRRWEGEERGGEENGVTASRRVPCQPAGAMRGEGNGTTEKWNEIGRWPHHVRKTTRGHTDVWEGHVTT